MTALDIGAQTLEEETRMDAATSDNPDRPLSPAASIAERDAVSAVPVPPTTREDLGLEPAFLDGLILKTLYTWGTLSGDRMAESLEVPFWALDDTLLAFQRHQLAEVLHSEGMGRRGYTFTLTGEGRKRARETFEVEPYVGPAPVPIDRYRYWVDRQSVRRGHVGPDEVREGFKHLVLDDHTIDLLGPAINSSRSIFLYGDAGNGKTTISEAVVNIFGDHIYVPRAVYSDGQVIQLFDLTAHEPVGTRSSVGQDQIVLPAPEFDYRFVKIERPLVIAGGELTLDQLEFQFDRRIGAYQAPPHMRANGGVFVIDDFGRQRVPPRELLNRWMIPLDRGVDYLAFESGRRAAIPFDCVVIFATNLNPSALVEEAFLRRIRYKIEIGSPDRKNYKEIFRRVCVAKGIEYRDKAVDWIYDEYYDGHGIAARSCHPGDLLAELFDLAAYYGEKPELNIKRLGQACASYFMDLPRGNGNGSQERGKQPPEEGGPRHGVRR